MMAIYQKNPFNDRNYLTTLNSLLIVVLGLLIFTIAERNNTSKITINDYLNIGLAFVTIILNSITLSASIFRTASDIYGLTPNRITILGINFLVFIHLLGILFNYVRFVWKSNPFEKLENWIAGYLSYYAIWAILVSVLLPIIFWYKWVSLFQEKRVCKTRLPNKACTWRWGFCAHPKQFSTPYHFSGWTASPSPPQRR